MSKYKVNIKAKDIKIVLSEDNFDESFFLLFNSYCQRNEVEAIKYMISVNKNSTSLDHECLLHTLVDLYLLNNYNLIDYLIENTDIHYITFLVFLLEQKKYEDFKLILQKHNKLIDFFNSEIFHLNFINNYKVITIKKFLSF